MPQSAYDKLAFVIASLRPNNLYFDPCANNILVDHKLKQFNTIDHLEEIGPYETLVGMYCALIDTMYLALDEIAFSNHGMKDESILFNQIDSQHRRIIYNKCLLASGTAKLPIGDKEEPVNKFGFIQYSLSWKFVLKTLGQA